MASTRALRVGVGGPVGSGKTALMDALCKLLRGRYEIAAITNDIYTKWDAEYLVRSGALVPERIAGVETGGCPHTAIREDASANLSGRTMTIAPPPSLITQQSSRCSGEAIMGEFTTSSTVTNSGSMACGLYCA